MTFYKINPDLPAHYAVRILMVHSSAVVRTASWDKPQFVDGEWRARWMTDEAHWFDATEILFVNWEHVVIVTAQFHPGPAAAEEQGEARGLPN